MYMYYGQISLRGGKISDSEIFTSSGYSFQLVYLSNIFGEGGGTHWYNNLHS